MQTKPKLRFKEFNDDWLTTTIGKVSQGNLSYGMNAAAKDFDGTNKYIRITDIDEFSNKYLYDNVVSPAGKLDNNFLLKNNDIIFARTGASTGKTYLYNPEDGILYYAGFLIKAHIKDDICAKFIFYCTKLDKYKKWVSITSLRSGQPGINAQEYSNYKFKIPTLLEQEKIAGFLSKVDELINECEAEVKDLEEQKKGLMQKIFSQQIRFKDSNNNPYPDWEYMPVGKVFDTITDFVAAGSFADLRKNVEYQNRPSYAQLIRTVDLKKKFQQDDAVYVNEAAFKFLWRVNLDENSLILPNIGANIGEVYYVTPNKLPYIHNVLGPNAILLKSSKNNLSYLYAYAQTDYFKKALFLQVGASGQPKFNKTDLKTIIVPIPYLEEQEKIAKVLSKMDELIEEKKALLSDWQRFKKGLLQQMFV